MYKAYYYSQFTYYNIYGINIGIFYSSQLSFLYHFLLNISLDLEYLLVPNIF